MKPVDQLSVKIFADGADLAGMLEMYRQAVHQGLHHQPDADAQGRHHATTARSRREVLQAIPDRPISFEVFSDEFAEMERQAREIATWGENVYVKIPVTNTRRESACDLVRRLSHAGVKLNVTALMTLDQVRDVVARRSAAARRRASRCSPAASPTPAAIRCR